MILFNKQKQLEEIEFPKEISISDKKYEILIVFSKKKSSSATVKGNNLIFRMSSYLSKKQAEEHFDHLLKKLYKKLQMQNVVSSAFTFDEVFEKGNFKFANEYYKIEFKKIRAIILKDNVFYVNPKIKKETIQKRIIQFLTEKYLIRIQNYVKQVNQETYNYKIGEISLKLVNSKWGHCTSQNDIMLNLKLLNADIEILRYVIIHELAHIKYKNHSKSYWMHVQKYCSNYKILRKNLKLTNPGIYY